MTPDEIDRIMERLDKLERANIEFRKSDSAMWRILYLILGTLLGTGALQLWQVVG